MKILETQFISGAGGYSSDPLTYTQVARNDNFAVYERSRDGKVKDYEVFRIKVLKAGTCIFQQVLAEDEEQYATSSSFGKTAWSFTGGIGAKGVAMAKFDSLTKAWNEPDEEETPDTEENFKNLVNVALGTEPRRRGRQAIERPDLVFPSTETWTMKDLLALNPAPWSQPLAYVELQKRIESGEVVEAGRIFPPGGRGRASVVYKKVK
jgi:hypothetical protein